MSSVDECVTTSIVALTILRRSLRFGAAPSRGPCSIHTKTHVHRNAQQSLFPPKISAQSRRPVIPQTWPFSQATKDRLDCWLH
jgi:hypothetical protein